MTEDDPLRHENEQNGKRMKILHLLYESRGDPFGIGGVGIRAYEIYRRIQDRHDVTLLCKKYPGAIDGPLEGLRHIFVGTESRSLTKTLLSYAYHASRFVQRHGHEYDIIVEEFSPGIPTFYRLFTTRPVVLQLQGYTGVKYFEKYNIVYSLVLYLFERLLPLFYRNFIFVSEAAKRRYRLDDHRNNITIVSNGIAEELLSCDSGDSDYMLYLGRIDIHHKGLDILLDAFRDFNRTFPHIKLVLGGDGRDREKFKALFQKLPESIKKNIELRGWVDGEEKEELLKNALMVVMPSRYETQGIVALEAMAYGKAVIVSDIPELRYVTQNKAGVSFRAGDALSMAQSMKNLMASGERKQMGQRGRDWVKHYTWEKIALQYEAFLYNVAIKGQQIHHKK
jgi:glycosyltransferase involved in cell wall biosynthesis